mmetsp:Transcript_25759/g.58290  ORF Transcript_25759/g.58290 Transcript_25759/m.58290 type:complete len:318 (+) Transcript_25759:525-1478(+)
MHLRSRSAGSAWQNASVKSASSRGPSLGVAFTPFLPSLAFASTAARSSALAAPRMAVSSGVSKPTLTTAAPSTSATPSASLVSPSTGSCTWHWARNLTAAEGVTHSTCSLEAMLLAVSDLPMPGYPATRTDRGTSAWPSRNSVHTSLAASTSFREDREDREGREALLSEGAKDKLHVHTAREGCSHKLSAIAPASVSHTTLDCSASLVSFSKQASNSNSGWLQLSAAARNNGKALGAVTSPRTRLQNLSKCTMGTWAWAEQSSLMGSAGTWAGSRSHMRLNNAARSNPLPPYMRPVPTMHRSSRQVADSSDKQFSFA